MPYLHTASARLALVLSLLLLAPVPAALAQAQRYEVWLVDQANAGQGGSAVYIYPGESFGTAGLTAQPELVDLEMGAREVGDGPGVRPHLLLFNQKQSHAILAYVTSGHVQVIRASDRKIVSSVDIGDQAHGAVPAPDDSYILAANQNGKKLARIKANFTTEQFSHEVAADFDLKALESEQLPDNAPICPTIFGPDGKKVYVTLRGGGLLIMDTSTTPMRVLKTYTKEQIAPAGCGGVIVGTKMYVNSGTPTSSSLYVFDTTTDNLVKSLDLTNTGTDAHGMVVVGGGRYIWMANRGDNDNVVVIDTSTDSVVGTFVGVGQAPDLMDLAPSGDHVFVSSRGAANLTGGPSAKGEIPGMAVLSVKSGGREGELAYYVPLGAASSTADPHGIAVRRLAAPAAAPAPAAPARAAPAAPAPAAPAAAPAAPVQMPSALPRTGAPLLDLSLPAAGLAASLGGLLLVLRTRRR